LKFYKEYIEQNQLEQICKETNVSKILATDFFHEFDCTCLKEGSKLQITKTLKTAIVKILNLW
jgi:hypothetical protein